MKDYLDKVKATVYETNEKGEMKQNVRNAFRSDTQNALAEQLKTDGLEIVETAEGLGVRMENGEEGEIITIVSVTVKPLGYDLDTAHQEYVNDLAEKKAKAEKAEADKLAKIAKQKADKEALAKKTTK